MHQVPNPRGHSLDGAWQQISVVAGKDEDIQTSIVYGVEVPIEIIVVGLVVIDT